MKKIIFSQLIIIYLLIFSLTSICFGTETIKIGAIFDKTGEASSDGNEYFKIIRFLIEEANNNGGLIGKKIELLEFNNQGTQLGSRLSAKRAVESGVVAVIGACWSSNSTAAAQILQAAKIPMISPNSTDPKVTLIGDYIFRACFTDPFQGAVMAKFAVDDLKARTAIVLTNISQQYCVGLSDVFINKFKEYNGEILWQGRYHQDDTDFTPLIIEIQKLNPDIIYLPGYQQDSALIMMQARKKGIKTIFIGGDGWDNIMYKYSKDAIIGNIFSLHYHVDAANEMSRSLMNKYQEKNDAIEEPYRLILAYDAVTILFEAIKKANSVNPSTIRDAIAKTKDIQGATGLISIDENGDPVKSAVIVKFGENYVIYLKTVNP
ncbi:MAG: ABC transporter substrate-binding protein [Desulfobacterales bacterium]|nr:ABC transporter substrate-binding protein [Desulfobacterales bacterium]